MKIEKKIEEMLDKILDEKYNVNESKIADKLKLKMMKPILSKQTITKSIAIEYINDVGSVDKHAKKEPEKGKKLYDEAVSILDSGKIKNTYDFMNMLIDLQYKYK